MELGSVTEQKKKNIESETVVTDLICIVVLFSAVLGQHCGLHVCTIFFFFHIHMGKGEEGERKSKKKRKKRYRKYHLTQSVRRRYSYLN